MEYRDTGLVFNPSCLLVKTTSPASQFLAVLHGSAGPQTGCGGFGLGEQPGWRGGCAVDIGLDGLSSGGSVVTPQGTQGGLVPDCMLRPASRQHAAEQRRGAAPKVVFADRGLGIVETFAITYGRDGDAGPGTVVLRLPDDMRTLARVDPADLRPPCLVLARTTQLVVADRLRRVVYDGAASTRPGCSNGSANVSQGGIADGTVGRALGEIGCDQDGPAAVWRPKQADVVAHAVLRRASLLAGRSQSWQSRAQARIPGLVVPEPPLQRRPGYLG